MECQVKFFTSQDQAKNTSQAKIFTAHTRTHTKSAVCEKSVFSLWDQKASSDVTHPDLIWTSCVEQFYVGILKLVPCIQECFLFEGPSPDFPSAPWGRGAFHFWLMRRCWNYRSVHRARYIPGIHFCFWKTSPNISEKASHVSVTRKTQLFFPTLDLELKPSWGRLFKRSAGCASSSASL